MKYWFRNLRNYIAGDDRRHYTNHEVMKMAEEKKELASHIILHTSSFKTELSNVAAPGIIFETECSVKFHNVEAEELILKDPSNLKTTFISSDDIYGGSINKISSSKKHSSLLVEKVNNLSEITATGQGNIYLSHLKNLQHLYLENLENIEKLNISNTPALETGNNYTLSQAILEPTFHDFLGSKICLLDLSKKDTGEPYALILSKKNDICFLNDFKGTKDELVTSLKVEKDFAEEYQNSQEFIDQRFQDELKELQDRYNYQTDTRTELSDRSDRNTTNVTIALNLTGFEYGA